MIFDGLVNLLMGVLTGVFALLPSYTPDFPSFAGFGAAIGGANSAFPVVTLGVCILSLLGLQFFLFGVTLVTWIWDKVPFTFK